MNLHPGRWPWLSAGFALLLIALYFVPGAFDVLYWDRDMTLAGQWWRFFTGHLVHLSQAHLAYNVGAFLILGMLLEPHYRRSLCFLLLAGMTVVSLCLYLSDLERYSGLSGALNALVYPAVWCAWSRSGSLIPWVIAALHTLRLLIEWLNGSSLVIQDLPWPSYTPAHLQGLAVGIAGLILLAGLTPKATQEHHATD